MQSGTARAAVVECPLTAMALGKQKNRITLPLFFSSAVVFVSTSATFFCCTACRQQQQRHTVLLQFDNLIKQREKKDPQH